MPLALWQQHGYEAIISFFTMVTKYFYQNLDFLAVDFANPDFCLTKPGIMQCQEVVLAVTWMSANQWLWMWSILFKERNCSS